jgi:hypothetical protein
MIYPKNMEHLVCIYLISTIYDILSQHRRKWVSVRIRTQKIHTKENHKKIVERIYSYRPGDDGAALYCIGPTGKRYTFMPNGTERSETQPKEARNPEQHQNKELRRSRSPNFGIKPNRIRPIDTPKGHALERSAKSGLPYGPGKVAVLITSNGCLN